MNTSPTDDDSQAVSEATDLLVLLVDDPTNASLHAKIQKWRKAKPAHDAAWLSMVDIWHLTGDIGPVALPLDTSTDSQISIGLPKSPASPRRRAIFLASALCMIGLGFLFGDDIRLSLMSDYRTGTAENRIIQLPDGSTATLGARSAIALRYTPQARQVQVLAGEVFFSVRHDDAHPFTAIAGGATVRDIGTRFDIDKEKDRIVVAVNEGNVGLTYGTAAPSPERHMTAGDVISIDLRSRTMTTSRMDPGEIGSWQQKRLTVSDASVHSVVETFRRYYPGIIVSYGEDLNASHVAGTYDLTDIPGALRAVAAPTHVAVREVGSHFLLIGGKLF
ncbi:FecR domain-containing protein [Acetobacter sp. TBRC 12305]|uniref:FecR domain-containing protein n=1 Tax=Acetobacter garciniae TaxID=2817435 RepID=A0A939HQK7_9PROT|nr:FecR domain-containing protein [Acetobacter garciniae]MBO1326313.1 FecR domain-containing protein [Acetobacter garciniae]MBX0346381.1 FecR domain-containing protein [Acetobacter garciniae]